MTSSWLRRIVSILDLLPLLSVKVESEHIVKSHSRVVDTTVATENVDFIVNNGGRSIGSRARSTGWTFLVTRSLGFLSFSSFPGEVLGNQEPGIVETNLGCSVTAEDENFVVTGS